jgi:hypothetical protein
LKRSCDEFPRRKVKPKASKAPKAQKAGDGEAKKRKAKAAKAGKVPRDGVKWMEISHRYPNFSNSNVF